MEEEKSQLGSDAVVDPSDDISKVTSVVDKCIEPIESQADVKPNGDDGLEESLENEKALENHVENSLGGMQNDSQDDDVQPMKDDNGIETSDYQSRTNTVTLNEETKDDDVSSQPIANESSNPSDNKNIPEKAQRHDTEETSTLKEETQAKENNEDSHESQTFTQANEEIETSDNPESETLKNTLDESQSDVAESQTFTQNELEESGTETANDSQDIKTDSQAKDNSADSESTAKASSAKDDDDIENPSFENAPEPAEQSTEDHTEASDPFDELLKGADDVTAEKTTDATTESVNADNDNQDDDNHGSHYGDDDAVPDEPSQDVVVVGEPGEDEEVCLLPDMEREISEADRLKALEASKILKSEETTAVSDTPKASEPPSESPAEAVSGGAPEVESETAAVDAVEDLLETADGQPEVGLEDAPAVENKDNSSNVIQEISPFDNPCIQCSVDKPCTFKLMRDNTVQYICNSACVDKFVETSGTKYTIKKKSYRILEIVPTVHVCSECEDEILCYFYYNSDGEDTHYCSLRCLHGMMADEQHKYTFKRKIINVDEIDSVEKPCSVCDATSSRYTFSRYGEKLYLCTTECMKSLNEAEGGRYKLKSKVCKTPVVKVANMSLLTKPLLKLKVISNATDKYLDEGYKIQAKTPAAAAAAREDRERSFIRRCVQCSQTVTGDEKNLTWETMDFCNETCLQRYQNIIGSKCANCKNAVNHTSLGKYCVRFGYDIRQFCCSTCLEDFKKGLKICCYCQRDISLGFDGFLAPVGDKGQFKDFCSKQCMSKFEQMSKNPIPQPVWAKCAVCSMEKPTQLEVEIDEDHSQRLCSDPCFAAFKFVNSICPDQCRWCKKYFERKSERCFTIYNDQQSHHCFCSKACMNVYISNSRHIVPCSWCKVKKYNFDMIKRTSTSGQTVMMCSLNCLNLYQVSVNAISSRRIKCDMCKRTSQAQYHLTMSDATVRNFCTYQCVMSFQGQYAKPNQSLLMGDQPVEQPKAVPTGAPRRTNSTVKINAQNKHQNQVRSNLPVISNVQSLASTAPPPKPQPPPKQTPPAKTPTVHVTRGKSKRLQTMQVPPPVVEPEPPRIATPPPPPKPPTPPPPPPPKIYNHVLVKTLPPVEVANKATMTKPMTVTKGVSCRPHPCTKECQTDSSLERRVLIPVPVPIYVPVPIAMYSLPFPIPVPIPIPIPTPVFIPTTRNSAKGIMKEITKIHDKMPTDPFEAELLMMAEMVAGDKKKNESDSETDDENDEGFSPDAMDGGNAFGEDMLQMALKMASEYEEPAVDLESAMTASTITPSSHPGMPGLDGEAMHHHQMMVLEQQRAVAVLRASQTAPPTSRGKRPPPAAAPVARPSRSSKRRRQEPAPPPPQPAREPVEKPDANMCLKYTFGVNAWKQWVMTKNAEIEKSSIRRKPFKSEILQLTADELNYSLCLFVKEVRKPNGSEYAPDTIYYLVLGIQQYLFENGRIDNIFTDPYYEKFTECLDEVARKFSVLYNDSQYIVTRVEEEHLWESKQLGAHSPHVLLSTLMFFNTKHFNLVTVEEHMQLSFSHIMKHWKRSPNQPGGGKLPGSRNVLLRFYPPQSALEANSRKKKVYEQQENEENPLRCPVKLYEFYISKCPESVRTRNDVFYLLPERSCVPDSPVWYSTQALGRDALAKMLHRVKMVKEINIALLTS